MQFQRVKGAAGIPFISDDNLCWLIPFACMCKYQERELKREMLAEGGDVQEGVWMKGACQ